MELFSELYSCYYQVAARILRAAMQKPLSRPEAARLVNELAFAESGLYLLPRLCGGEWELLDETPDGLVPRVGGVARLPLTDLQASWLKAALQDPRARLFFTDGQLDALEGFLAGARPLFSREDFCAFDVYSDGDPYADPGYRARFGRLLGAIRAKEPLKIHYRSPKGRETAGNILPLKLEYSSKDDKFRLYAARLVYNRAAGLCTFNLGRIITLESSRQTCEKQPDLDAWLRQNRCREPVRLRIYRERNALERCMLHFASYEKRTEYDEETDTFLCDIYYDVRDETELLIRVLSFGPVVRVLGPPPFLRQVRARVARQHRLLQGPSGGGEC